MSPNKAIAKDGLNRTGQAMYEGHCHLINSKLSPIGNTLLMGARQLPRRHLCTVSSLFWTMSTRRSRSRSRPRRNSRSPDSREELPHGASPISEDDYFQKSDEFRKWLKDEKGKVGQFLLDASLSDLFEVL